MPATHRHPHHEQQHHGGGGGVSYGSPVSSPRTSYTPQHQGAPSPRDSPRRVDMPPHGSPPGGGGGAGGGGGGGGTAPFAFAAGWKPPGSAGASSAAGGAGGAAPPAQPSSPARLGLLVLLGLMSVGLVLKVGRMLSPPAAAASGASRHGAGGGPPFTSRRTAAALSVGDDAPLDDVTAAPPAAPDRRRGPFAPPPPGSAPRWFEPDYAGWADRVGASGASGDAGAAADTAAAAAHPPMTTCVIVRTYVAQRNALMALLASLLASGHPGLYAVLLDTGKQAPFADLPDVAAFFNALAQRPVAFVSRWNYHNSRALYPELAVEDYGYVGTDLALEDAMYGAWPLTASGRPAVSCDTFLVTNGDNLYSGRFFEAALRAMAVGGYDMVGQHWISHYPWEMALWDSRSPEQLAANSPSQCGSMRAGRDMEMWAASDFHVNCIDLGAVLLRRWLLETTGVRFVTSELAKNATGRHFHTFTADGWAFQNLAKSPGARVTTIREVYMVHQ